jgi:hypothetical protein
MQRKERNRPRDMHDIRHDTYDPDKTGNQHHPPVPSYRTPNKSNCIKTSKQKLSFPILEIKYASERTKGYARNQNIPVNATHGQKRNITKTPKQKATLHCQPDLKAH